MYSVLNMLKRAHKVTYTSAVHEGYTVEWPNETDFVNFVITDTDTGETLTITECKEVYTLGDVVRNMDIRNIADRSTLGRFYGHAILAMV